MASEQCETHPFEGADDRCGACGRTYCIECIVYPFGPRKPPMCKSCAISASGIRKNASRAPVASRRQLRREARARKKDAKVKAKTTAPSEEHTSHAPPVSAAAPPVATPPPVAPPDSGRARKTAQTAGVVAGLGVASDDSQAGPAYRSDFTPI